MLNLKSYARQANRKVTTNKDQEVFKTIGFDPEELEQLKEMDETELKLLMIFCGIRVYNEMPLCALEEDEMRMAYVIWRADKIKEKRQEVSKKMERGIKWTERLLDLTKIWSRSI